MPYNESISYAYEMWAREIMYIESMDYGNSDLLREHFGKLRGARDLVKCFLKYYNPKHFKNKKLLERLLYRYRITVTCYSDYRKMALKSLGIVGQKYNDLISKLKQDCNV